LTYWGQKENESRLQLPVLPSFWQPTAGVGDAEWYMVDGRWKMVDGAAADALEWSDNQFPCHIPRSPVAMLQHNLILFITFFHPRRLLSHQKAARGGGAF